MAGYIDWLVTEEDAEIVRNNLSDIQRPVFLEKHDSITKRDKRRIKKASEIKRAHQKKYNKLENYSNFASVILGSVSAIITIPSLLVSLIFSLGPIIYLTLFETETKMRKQLTEVFAFENSSSRKGVAAYRDWWNNKLQSVKYLAALLTLSFLYKISSYIYEIAIEVLQGAMDKGLTTKKELAKYAYSKSVRIQRR